MDHRHKETLKATEDAVDVTIGKKDMDISTDAEDTGECTSKTRILRRRKCKA